MYVARLKIRRFNDFRESVATVTALFILSARISLRGMLRLIRVDTLRKVHNVGFLAIRLILRFSLLNTENKLSKLPASTVETSLVV